MSNREHKIILIGDKIMVREHDHDKMSKSGLKYISKEGNKSLGTIVQINEKNEKSSEYSVGEEISYPRMSGVNVEIDGNNYKVLETREIFFKYIDGVPQAVNGFVIIDPMEENKGSKLRSVSQDVKTRGKIVSLSKGHDESLTEGMLAVFSQYSGFKAISKEKEFIVLSEEEIFFATNN